MNSLEKVAVGSIMLVIGVMLSGCAATGQTQAKGVSSPGRGVTTTTHASTSSGAHATKASTTVPPVATPPPSAVVAPTSTTSVPSTTPTTSTPTPWPRGNPVHYRATDLKGREVSLSSLAGSPVLLIAWATWCVDCHQEMADLGSSLAQHSTGRVKVVAVEVDDPAGAPGAEQVAQEDGLSIEMWIDESNAFASSFGTLGVPTAALISSDGTLYKTFPGAVELSQPSLAAAMRKVR